MIDAETIHSLKEEHGPTLFLGALGRSEVVFKPLTFAEYRYVVENEDVSAVDIEEYVIIQAVVYPESVDIDNALAGHVSSLARDIIENSAFSDVDTARNALLEARENSQNVFEAIKAIILAAMPLTDIEELNNKNYFELVDLVVLAENIFKVQREAIETEYQLEILDPNEQENESLQLRKNQAKVPGQAKEQDPIAQKLKQALGTV